MSNIVETCFPLTFFLMYISYLGFISLQILRNNKYSLQHPPMPTLIANKRTTMMSLHK